MSDASRDVLTGAVSAAGSLRIAIASDLHAYEAASSVESEPPSHLAIGSPEDQPGKHPIAGLLKLIETERLDAHVLLCPGDLGDKARPSAVAYAWSAIHRIATKLAATSIVATAGNHDLDSRHKYNDHDPRGVLQALVPQFPLADELLCDRYWSRNFAIVELEQCRIVTLNSSAFHGVASEEERHGRVSDHTLGRLKTALEESAVKPVNVLLCHHHPQQHMELRLGDYDVMKQGQLLLELLGSGRYGEWLLVHGHKHHPKLTYAAGGASAPVIFSAGSLCASLYLELQSRARNQFYVLDLPLSRFAEFGLVGRFSAWEWSSGVGWITAGTNSGLPARGGFGYRGKTQPLATRITTTLGRSASFSREKLIHIAPEIEFLIPRDLDVLFQALKAAGLRNEADEYPATSPTGAS